MATMRFHHRIGKTMLSVQDMALIFRDNLGRATGLWRASAALLDWEFYTPEPSDDPFAQFSSHEPPTFAVGSQYGIKGQLLRGNLGHHINSRTGGVVVLEIWERQSETGRYRAFDLGHVGDLSPASQSCVELVMKAFAAADPLFLLDREDKGRQRV